MKLRSKWWLRFRRNGLTLTLSVVAMSLRRVGIVKIRVVGRKRTMLFVSRFRSSGKKRRKFRKRLKCGTRKLGYSRKIGRKRLSSPKSRFPFRGMMSA